MTCSSILFCLAAMLSLLQSGLATPAHVARQTTSTQDIQAYLSAHNTVRARHGAVALVWSDLLAGKARQWAANCNYVHSGGTLGNYGENLAWGTGSSYGIAAAVKSWTDEVSKYNPANPGPSAHFTQVVWKGTTHVGCALQVCNGSTKFIVCEYSPPGNIAGRYPANVQV